MICSKCKHNFDYEPFEEVKFCPNCGNKVELNHCTNSKCKTLFDGVTILKDDECYCKKCGSKSSYYEQGLINSKCD